MNSVLNQFINKRVSNSTRGKKIIILSYLLFLSLGQAFAQSDFRPGYVLKSELDTIFGEIDNKDYHSNSNFCDFRYPNSSEIIRYFPRDIFGYHFLNGKFYISRETPLPNNTLKEIFLEYLIKGGLNIYFYQDYDKRNIYYAEKDTLGLMELSYYKEIIHGHDSRYKEAERKYQGNVINNRTGMYLYEQKRFQGILAYLTYDEPRVKQQVLNINEPSHTELIKLAKNYHELTCLDEDCIIYEKRMRNQMKFSISAGNFMIIRKSEYDQDINENIPRNSPSIALNLYITMLARSERIYLGLGLRHEFLKIYHSEKYEFLPNTTRIPLSVNYFHPKEGLSPIFSYAFDLKSYANVNTLTLGLNYRINKFSLYLTADIDTYRVTKVFAASQRLGISYDFNQPQL